MHLTALHEVDAPRAYDRRGCHGQVIAEPRAAVGGQARRRQRADAPGRALVVQLGHALVDGDAGQLQVDQAEHGQVQATRRGLLLAPVVVVVLVERRGDGHDPGTSCTVRLVALVLGED